MSNIEKDVREFCDMFGVDYQAVLKGSVEELFELFAYVASEDYWRERG